MVGIRRRQPFSLHHRRQVGSSSKSSSSTFLVAIRNLTIAVVAIQGLRMLIGRSTQQGTPNIPPNAVANDEPKGLADRLKDSTYIRKPSPSLPERNNDASPLLEKDESEDEDAEEENNEPVDHADSDVADEKDKSDRDVESLQEPEILAEDEKVRTAGSDLNDEPFAGSGLNPVVVNKIGTGKTQVAYVKDFIHERQNRVYGTVDVAVNGDVSSSTLNSDALSLIASLVQEKSVKPCKAIQSGGQEAVDPRCLDPDTPIIVYNPEPFPRIWCGQEIKPRSAVTMTEHCTDPIVHLFPVEVPPVSGEHMPPIIIMSTPDKQILPDDSSLETVECNISCRREKDLLGVERYVDGETWTITQTMADGYFDNVAKMDRRDFMHDHYYSTQSFMSAIPMTYFSFEKYSLRNRPAIDFDKAKPKAVYLVDGKCASQATNRHRYFDALTSVVSVDSYGSCGHNIDVPAGMTMDTPEGRIELMQNYRIVLAFDSSSSKDHISGLVWEAFASGSLPVVVGAENIREHFPPKSFIYAKDFSNWDELAAHVEKATTDKVLWESYHAWRKDDMSWAPIEARYSFVKTSPICRLCQWAYAKKYGLGWDHEKQQVRAMKVPTDKFCVTADNGLLSRPFSEQWVSKKLSAKGEVFVLREDSEGESCSSLSTEGKIDINSYKGHRKIIQHDGVTDFIISESERENTDTEVILRLEFPGIRNPDGAFFNNTHSMVPTMLGEHVSSATIQDDSMKVTVLADWKTVVSSTGEGRMEVIIQRKGEGSMKDESPRRIRVLIEELAFIHDKMTEYLPSSYSKQMTKDFVDPLRMYYADS